MVLVTSTWVDEYRQSQGLFEFRSMVEVGTVRIGIKMGPLRELEEVVVGQDLVISLAHVRYVLYISSKHGMSPVRNLIPHRI